MLGHKSYVVTNSRASMSINNYGILYHIYFASEVVSMEVEQAHFDEFFEVHRTMHMHIIFSVYIHVYVCMYVCMYVHTCVPYLSVLKPGSNTRRGSNIYWVVQQNERNKHLGLFKHRVPKLLNLKWC